MAVETRTDFDIMNDVFIARQKYAQADSDFDIAKAARKAAEQEMNRAYRKMDLWHLKRRDELAMPPLPFGASFEAAAAAEQLSLMLEEDEKRGVDPVTGNTPDVRFVRCAACFMSMKWTPDLRTCSGCSAELPDSD